MNTRVQKGWQALYDYFARLCTIYIHIYTGDSLTLQSGDVCATAWMDRRVVMVMSTGCDPHAVCSVQRREKGCSRGPVRYPDSIILYNQHMGGVDRGDQKRGYYQCRTQSHKFYKYIFKFLLDVSITNISMRVWNILILHHQRLSDTACKDADQRLQLSSQAWQKWWYCSSAPVASLPDKDQAPGSSEAAQEREM